MRRSARTPRTSRSLVAACLLAAGTLGTFASTAHAQVGTAITYQGLLERNGVKVATATDMRFTLFDAATGGNAVGTQVTRNAESVSNGLFNVALDFGVNPYTADAARWMQIEVRNPAGSGSFVPMGARQKLTPSPFSLATRGINVAATGEVGIGVPNPGFPLDVSGRVKVCGASGSGGIWYTDDDAPATEKSYFGRGGPSDRWTGVFSVLTGVWPMVVKDSGGVGIGTTTPAANTKVHMEQPFILNGFSTNLLLRQPIASWGLGPEFANYRYIQTQAAAANADGNFKQFNVGPGGVSIGYPNTPAYGSVDAMYVNGFVGIGTNTPSEKLDVAGNIKIRTNDRLYFGAPGEDTDTFSLSRYQFAADQNVLELALGDNASATGNDSFVINTRDTLGNGARNTIFQFNSSGIAQKAGGGTWAGLCDERSKNDIEPMTGTLDRLLQLKGHSYTYKPEYVQNGRALPGTQIGLVAQEVEAVFPDWVTTGPDGLKVVTERSTTALMVEAMRDLRNEKDAEIKTLQARLEKLEALLSTQNAGSK